jgi:alpha-ketoglutarate-dependent taurine dioxygenase
MSTAAADAMGLESVDLSPRIGARMNASVEDLVGGKHTRQIRQLLEQRGVLVFPELNMGDEEQKAFTLTLGEMMLQREKEFMTVTLDRSIEAVAGYLRATFFWHIDMIRFKVPNFATVLSARVVSETGGETEFANTYAAWDDLPEEDKREYEGLRVMHNHEASQFMYEPEPTLAELEDWRDSPSEVQPLVWTHKSGRKSLVIGASAAYICDKSPEESRWILTRLREWATQPQFVYQHRWKVGDVVLWDNTGTMHRARPYPLDSGRLMRRTVIAGEEPLS